MQNIDRWRHKDVKEAVIAKKTAHCFKLFFYLYTFLIGAFSTPVASEKSALAMTTSFLLFKSKFWSKGRRKEEKRKKHWLHLLDFVLATLSPLNWIHRFLHLRILCYTTFPTRVWDGLLARWRGRWGWGKVPSLLAYFFRLATVLGVISPETFLIRHKW